MPRRSILRHFLKSSQKATMTQAEAAVLDRDAEEAVIDTSPEGQMSDEALDQALDRRDENHQYIDGAFDTLCNSHCGKVVVVVDREPIHYADSEGDAMAYIENLEVPRKVEAAHRYLDPFTMVIEPAA